MANTSTELLPLETIVSGQQGDIKVLPQDAIITNTVVFPDEKSSGAQDAVYFELWLMEGTIRFRPLDHGFIGVAIKTSDTIKGLTFREKTHKIPLHGLRDPRVKLYTYNGSFFTGDRIKALVTYENILGGFS